MMSEAHVKHVARVNVLIKCFFDQILRFVSGQMADSVQKSGFSDKPFKCRTFICILLPGVEEYEPQVERSSKHEHVGMKFQFGDG
jgi:hypothetical protein